MKLHKHQSGFGMVFEIIVVAVVLVAIGAAVYGYYQGKKTASTNTSPSPAATTSPSLSPVPAADPYAGWSTFVGTCSHFNFQYPADWQSVLGDAFIEGSCQPARVTSPGGNVLVWVPNYYGDGPGCDWSGAAGGKNECPIITTLVSENLGKSGDLTGVYFVKQILCGEGKCEGRIALVGPATQSMPSYTVGTSQRYPLVAFGPHAMYMTQGKQTSIGNPTLPLLDFSEASAKAWLSSADVQQAELAMRSLVQ